MMNTIPQKVVIVGNGYLPYLIALFFQKKLKSHPLELTIVDLGNPTITEFLQSLGSMRHFHSELGLAETEFVKATKAEINLGFDYSGFANTQDGELFCDTQYGFDLNHWRFSHLFNKFRQFNPTEKLENYCLTAQLARSGRFTPPSPNARSLYAGIHYGYRLTGDAYAACLKSKLAASGTRIFQSPAVSVTLDEKGFIAAIDLPDIGTLQGDLFIDASEGRYLKNTLSPQQPLQPMLPSSLHLEIQRTTTHQQQKCTTSKISVDNKKLHLSGSHLGLDHRITLSSNVEMADALFVDNRPWIKNCIAMGQAFTNRVSILIDNSHLYQSMLLRLLELWPRSTTWDQEALAYNHNTRAEFKNMLDMDQLHLALALDRLDILSEEMRYKLDTFRQIGKVAYYEKELLQEPQWPVLFNALGIFPATVDLSVQACTQAWLSHEFLRIKSSFAKAAEAAPVYRDFIGKAHG